VTRHRLDVITALLPERAAHLAEATRSVRDTRTTLARDGVELRWHLVVDGRGADLPRVEEADHMVVLGRHCGVSAARNLGLAQADGDSIMPFDGDDLLLADGVRHAIDLLEQHRDVGWVGGASEIYETETVSSDNEVHRLARASNHHVPDHLVHWRAGTLGYPVGRPWPFHPNVLLVRTAVALSVGGWPAVPASEDKGFSARLAASVDGLQTPRALIAYRLWEHQTTNSAGFSKLDAAATTFNLRTLGLRAGATEADGETQHV
jgi:hypothetical protein